MDFIIRQRKPIPWKSILVSSVLLIGWIVFAWIYFGSPIPVTLAAKQQQGLMANSESFARGFLTVISSNSSWFLISEVALALMGLILDFLEEEDLASNIDLACCVFPFLLEFAGSHSLFLVLRPPYSGIH